MHFITAFLARHVRNEWYRADRVFPTVLVFQLGNRVTDFEEIWYGHYANGGCPKFVRFNFLLGHAVE
jgi:hypothetical protein